MSRSRMSFNALRAFEAVARLRSVRAAASELGVTPGAVSQQLLVAEYALKLPLFTRAAKRLHPTAEGIRLAERLGLAFEQIDVALDEAHASTAPNVLRLRIAPTMAARWLMPRLADFVGRYPDLHVELTTNVVQGNEPGLEGVDFAIRLVEEVMPGEDAMLLFPDALSPVCSPSLLTSLQAPEDLASAQLLHSMLREDSWKIWSESAGVTIPEHGGTRFATAELAYQAAAAGVGVAIAQMAYVEADLRQGRLVQPFAHVATSLRTYYLVNAEYKRDWRKVRLFRSWMANELGETRSGST